MGYFISLPSIPLLRMRIGSDFTTLGTLLLIPTLVQHIGCAGYTRLVRADTILWCWADTIYLLTTWRVLEPTV